MKYKWTTTRPTQSGWYWVIHESEAPTMVFVGTTIEGLGADGFMLSAKYWEEAQWVGPLFPPPVEP